MSKKKTAAIRNCLGEDIQKDLLKDMSSSPFSLMVDGNNDAGLEKMFPINICIFDVTFNRIVPMFFVMNMLQGKVTSTGEFIFISIDQQHVEKGLLWNMVSAIRLENTNANIGEHNFIKSIATEKNPEMVFLIAFAIFYIMPPARLLMPLTMWLKGQSCKLKKH